MISEDGGFVKALKDFVRARMAGEDGDVEWGLFEDECFGWTSQDRRDRVWGEITNAEMDWPTTAAYIVPVLVGWLLDRP